MPWISRATQALPSYRIHRLSGEDGEYAPTQASQCHVNSAPHPPSIFLIHTFLSQSRIGRALFTYTPGEKEKGGGTS